MEHPDSINELGMFDQYRYYYDFYYKKYKKLAVVMEEGDFYEMRGCDNESTKICNIKEILEIYPLMLQNVSTPHYNTEKNPLKAGFPKGSLSRFLDFMVDKYDYVVVQVDQVGDRENSRNTKTRAVTAIHSPGTYISSEIIEDAEHRYLVQIVVEGYKNANYTPMVVGLSAIDIETGETDFYEVANNKDDENYALDEIWRYLNVHQPKEVLIAYRDISLDLETRIKQEIVTQVNVVNIPKQFNKINIQIKFLEKIFGNIILEELSKFMTARLSLIMLLDYASQHNKILVNNLKPPTIWFSNKYLLLANNAIAQLDLVSNSRNKNACVFNLVNFTSTNMGKRLLKHRLLNPLKDVNELKERYEMVEAFSNYSSYEVFLNGIIDLEKIHRKIELGILTPSQLGVLYNSYVKVERLVEICPLLTSKDFSKRIHKYIKFLKKSLIINKCMNFSTVDSINEPIFTDEYAPELSKMAKVIKDSRREIEQLVEEISCYIPYTKKGFDGWMKKKPEFLFNKPMVTLESGKTGYHLKITTNRFEMLKELIKKYDLELEIDEIGTNSSGKHSFITTSRLRKLSNRLLSAESQMKEQISELYRNFLKQMETVWEDTYNEITKFVSLADVYKSCAKCVKIYNYCKPKAYDRDFGFISAKKMRHPLAEQTCKSIYVPHNVKLGGEENGILIYGTNGGGKSCFMKSVGVNLILAQAGLFVAADSFKFSPYENVLTRILGNDDMQAGLSSFAVEMLELRGILARMGRKSLILGDELCKGTETVSAPALVAQSIVDLINKECNFVFATHLHLLVELDEIKNLDKLGVYHIKLKTEGKKIIYNREIEPGHGDSLYGIEVARAMGLPEDFIKGANKIRKRIIKDRGVLGKQGRYNPEMFLEKCGVCGECAEEVHHIAPQKDADSDGFIGHFHKNHLRNLVGLCKGCHKKVTYDKIKINKWIETSDGFELEWKK
jgi:DNA mismatch repair protein MutS